MKKFILVIVCGLVISGCRPYEEDNDSGVTSGNETDNTVAILAAALAAAQPGQQTESAIGTPFIGITAEELSSLPAVPVTETSNIEVARDFNFKTARKVAVDFNVEEARGLITDVSICTDYQVTAQGGYEVDYDSCLLSAPMFDGRLAADVMLVNEYQSILGIVWLPEEGSEPVFQEFLVNL